jgi:hypothetical protein
MTEKKTLKSHIEIIIGVFVVGTLALMVASSWNLLAIEFLEWLKQDNNVIGLKGGGLIAYTSIYAVLITIFSIIVLAILIKFEVVNHTTKLF